MFKIRKNRKEMHQLINQLWEANNVKTDEVGQPLNPMESVNIQAVHPVGFKPKLFMVLLMDEKGNVFTNATGQPNADLHIASMGMKYAVEQGIKALQANMKEPSPIVVAPAGSVPGLLRAQ